LGEFSRTTVLEAINQQKFQLSPSVQKTDSVAFSVQVLISSPFSSAGTAMTKVQVVRLSGAVTANVNLLSNRGLRGQAPGA